MWSASIRARQQRRRSVGGIEHSRFGRDEGKEGIEEYPETYGSQSMFAPLARALVHTPGPEYTQAAWSAYGLDGRADRERAVREHREFVAILEREGVAIDYLEEHASIQCTATYDPALVTDRGAIIMTSGRAGGRAERRGAALPMARKLLELDIPLIGWIRGRGCMDAGDTLWLDRDTLLVGRSHRSNDEGFRQLVGILDGAVSDVRQFELPNWLGAGHVLHLMSVVSLVDRDLAVVYPRALPIRLLELFLERDIRLIDVPDDEWESQGCNALALAPRVAVIAAGNPRTRDALHDAGATVHEYQGDQISRLRVSGPTCNSRPLLRLY